jgi:autotransporter-associated beta strand protein
MRRSFYLFFVVISFLSGGQLFAAVWTGATDNTWETDSNWQSNSQPAAGEAITFPDAATRKAITLTGVKQVGSLTFEGNYTLTGGTLQCPASSTNSVSTGKEVTLDSVISGASTRFVKTGLGRLILSGSNTYTGETELPDGGSGYLQINQKASLGTGWLRFNKRGENTGTLVVNVPGINVFNNGFGSFPSSQTHPHIQNLQGTNTFKGNVNITMSGGFGAVFEAETNSMLILEGTIQNGYVGTGGPSRRIYFNAKGELWVKGIIKDSTPTNITEYVKQNDGRLILSGANTYTGTTIFNAGEIVVGVSGTAGTLGASAVTMNATANKKLMFNRSDNVSFANTITTGSSSDQIVKMGANTLTLQNVGGSSPFDYKIEGGTLDLNEKTLTARNIEGGGTIQNAALTTSGTIDPNGTLNLPATTLGSGAKINIDFATAGGGVDDKVTFADSVNLSAVTLTLRSAAERISTGRYTLVSVPEGKTITKPTASVVGVPHTWTCEVFGPLFQMYYVGGTMIRFH